MNIQRYNGLSMNNYHIRNFNKPNQRTLNNQEISYGSIQTPGWTSIGNTEQRQTIKEKYQNKQKFSSQPQQSVKSSRMQQNKYHKDILNKLTTLPKLDLQQGFFSNVRMGSLVNKDNKNIVAYDSIKKKPQKQYKTLRQSKSTTYVSSFQKSKLGSENRQFIKTKQKIDEKDSRKRVSSMNVQPNLLLKDRIKQRISNGNYNKCKDFTYQLKSSTNNSNQKSQSNARKIKNSDKTLYRHQSARKVTQFKIVKQHDKTMKNNFSQKLLNRKDQRYNSLDNKIINKNKENKENKENFLTRLTQKKIPTKDNRFNTITVFDHLYNNSIRMNSKKKIQKMIEESYKKTTVLTFVPQISVKSVKLAESKYERLSRNEGEEQTQTISHCANICFKHESFNSKKPQKSIVAIQEQVTQKQKQKTAQKHHLTLFLKLFRYLSNGEDILTDKLMEENIENLPLSLIQAIDSAIIKIYQFKSIRFRQFAEMFKVQKQLISKKMLIINSVDNFFRRTKII